jgi:hypothetical protein
MERELQQRLGRRPSLAESRAVAAEVGKRLGLNGHSNGTPNKGAYAGVPSRQGGGGDGARPLINPATMTDGQKKLAMAAYRGTKEPKDAYKSWAAAMNKHLAGKAEEE